MTVLPDLHMSSAKRLGERGGELAPIASFVRASPRVRTAPPTALRFESS